MTGFANMSPWDKPSPELPSAVTSPHRHDRAGAEPMTRCHYRPDAPGRRMGWFCPSSRKRTMEARSARAGQPDPTSAPRSAGAARSSRRRFRTLNLAVFLPVLTAVGVFLVARQAQTWQQAGVLGLGLVAVLVTFERWSAGDVGRVALPCLVVAAVVWPYGVLAVDGEQGGAYYPIALVGSIVGSQVSRHRGSAATVLVAYVAAVGLLGLLTRTPAAAVDLIDYVIFPTGFTAVLTGLMFPNKRFYDVVADMERSEEQHV